MVRVVLKSEETDGFEDEVEDTLVLIGVKYVGVMNTRVFYRL